MINCPSGTHHTETGSSIEAWNVTPSSFRPCVVAAIAWLSVAAVLSSAVAFGQTERDPDPAEPATRQEQLRRQREARLDTVEPYRAGRLERLLINLENEQTIENLFEEPSPSSGGYYFTLGNITTGAGLTLGTGYNTSARLGRQVELSVRGAVSMRRYWMGEVEAAFPRLAGGRAFASVLARRSDYPEEDYFGPGPNSRLQDRVNFRHLQTSVESTGGVRLSRWFSLGGGVSYINPSIGSGKDSAYPSLEEVFTDFEAPGLSEQPVFIRPYVFAELDFGAPVDNPRTGGRYRVAYSYFADSELDRFSFERWEVDVRQYVSFLRGRRVLAFRGLASFSDPRRGHTVPFYLQQWLGGSHSLRGFRDFRLRDRHLVLLQTEYRWELFPALDAVLFYDAGKVASNRREINFKDFEANWGTGFRIGTDNGVYFRLDWALGSRDGSQLILKFSNVF